jgi:transposase InsO family protein
MLMMVSFAMIVLCGLFGDDLEAGAGHEPSPTTRRFAPPAPRYSLYRTPLPHNRPRAAGAGDARLILRSSAPVFRTDNESNFSSPILTGALWTLGIRHQRTDPFCPWQNGRIERFFGTFKERILRWWEEAGVPNEVQPDLDVLHSTTTSARIKGSAD